MGEPTLNDVMTAVTSLHGDVKVALDRTVNQATAIESITTRLQKQGEDIAGARGSAGVLGSLAAGVVVGIVEAAKAVIGARSGG